MTKRLFLFQKGHFHPEGRVWKQPKGNFLVHKRQFSSVFETKGTYSLKKKHFHTNEKGHSAPPPALSEVKEKCILEGAYKGTFAAPPFYRPLSKTRYSPLPLTKENYVLDVNKSPFATRASSLSQNWKSPSPQQSGQTNEILSAPLQREGINPLSGRTLSLLPSKPKRSLWAPAPTKMQKEDTFDIGRIQILQTTPPPSFGLSKKALSCSSCLGHRSKIRHTYLESV